MNAKTTTTRRPSTATMRAALVKAGSHTKASAAALDPKALVEAHAALGNQPTPTTPKATPAKAAKATPAPKPVKAPRPAPANCGCGCNAPTITERASFLPGHDARFAGLVGRGELVPSEAQAALVTPALQKKIDGIKATQQKRNAVKAARVAAKAAADKAFAEAMA